MIGNLTAALAGSGDQLSELDWMPGGASETRIPTSSCKCRWKRGGPSRVFIRPLRCVTNMFRHVDEITGVAKSESVQADRFEFI